MRPLRPVLLALLGLSAILFVAGCGSSDNGREDALASLQLTTETANLQSEMGKLVDDLAEDPSTEERERIERRLSAIDRSAMHIVSEARGEESGEPAASENIASAGQELRAASLGLVVVTKDPFGDRATQARERSGAESRSASRHLSAAVGAARAALADGGMLSADDRSEVEKARRGVGRAGTRAGSAFDALRTSEDRQRREAASAEEGIVQQEGSETEVTAGGCGTVQSEIGPLTVVAEEGVDCSEAMSVMQQYYDPSTPKEGSGGSSTIGDWFCISYSAGDLARGETDVTTCERQSGSGQIVARR